MIKFDNKLEIRYSFNDKSMLRVLADLLDVKMTAHCEPFSQEG